MGNGSSTSIGSTSGNGFTPRTGFTTRTGGTIASGSSTSTGSTTGTGFTSRQLHRLMAIATSKMTVKNFISIANCGKSNFKS
jgi:L-asparaginase/Glu-tRNA(Gln) amidotransferase subunit D